MQHATLTLKQYDITKIYIKTTSQKWNYHNRDITKQKLWWIMQFENGISLYRQELNSFVNISFFNLDFYSLQWINI